MSERRCSYTGGDMFQGVSFGVCNGVERLCPRTLAIIVVEVE